MRLVYSALVLMVECLFSVCCMHSPVEATVFEILLSEYVHPRCQQLTNRPTFTTRSFERRFSRSRSLGVLI